MNIGGRLVRGIFVVSYLALATAAQDGISSTNDLIEIKLRRFKQYSIDPNLPLFAREREAPSELLSNFRTRGFTPTPHRLSLDEQTVVEDGFRRLPPLHRRILKERLAAIYFINNLSTSGQSRPADRDEGYTMWAIILNASILKLNASEWLTEKERSCFSSDGSGISVSIDCGTNLNAFVYILLHEATHIVDFYEHITPSHSDSNTLTNLSLEGQPFITNVWQAFTTPVADYCFLLRDRVGFYGLGHNIPLHDALQVYSSFSKTPFVSLYGSLNWADDLAEYITVYHLTETLNQPYKIIVEKNGSYLMNYEPMKSLRVRDRVNEMRRFYRL